MMSAESNSVKSVSYQKKDGCPSFFWYDNDKDLKVYFFCLVSDPFSRYFQDNVVYDYEEFDEEYEEEEEEVTEIKLPITLDSE